MFLSVFTRRTRIFVQGFMGSASWSQNSKSKFSRAWLPLEFHKSIFIEEARDLSRSSMIPLLFISRCTRQMLKCSSNVNREARVRCARYILYWTHIAAARTLHILGSIGPQPCVLDLALQFSDS